MNVEKLRKALKGKISDTPLITNDNIDARVQEITQAVMNAIEQSVPWVRPFRQIKNFWSEECNTAVHKARRAFHNQLKEATPATEARYKEARNHKISVIWRNCRECFRIQIADATKDNQGTWRLTKWARIKANQPQSLP